MHRSLIRAGLIAAACVAFAAPVRADATVFVGTMTAASAGPTVGGAFGYHFVPTFGFEVEFANTIGGSTSASPSVTTITGGLVVQSAVPIRRVQVYAGAGAGLYGATAGDGRGSGEVGSVYIGAGTKVAIAEPLKLRLDYRLFLLGDAPDAAPDVTVGSHFHRFSVGLSLAF